MPSPVLKIFPANRVIKSMQYMPGDEVTRAVLKVNFMKGQSRSYNDVPPELFYKGYYIQDGAKLLQWYSLNIKKKYKVLEVAPTT